MVMILKLSCIFGVELSLLPLIQQQKREKYFANNRAWKTDIPADIQLKKDHKLVWVGEYLICVKCPPYEVQSAFLSHSGYKPHPGVGYSHTLQYTCMCRPTGSWFWSSWFRTRYPFHRHFLERGIKNCGSRLYLLLKIVADYEEAFIWYIGRTNKE